MKRTVTRLGIHLDGQWYYHPLLVQFIGETVLVETTDTVVRVLSKGV